MATPGSDGGFHRGAGGRAFNGVDPYYYLAASEGIAITDWEGENVKIYMTYDESGDLSMGTANQPEALQISDTDGSVSFSGTNPGFAVDYVKASSTANGLQLRNFADQAVLTLGVGGNREATFEDKLFVVNDFAVNTNKFVVSASTGNTTLTADAVLALSASASATEQKLIDFGYGGSIHVTNGANSDTLILRPGSEVNTGENSVNIQNHQGTLNLFKVDNEGIITGTSTVPADITGGATRGMVITSEGKRLSSTDATTAQEHNIFYNPNGLIASLQTLNSDFVTKIGQASGRYLVQSSAASTLLAIDGGASAGTEIRFPQYGAGTLQTDSSGNVTASSDSRLKNHKRAFLYGANEINQIADMAMGIGTWKPESGMDTENEYCFLYADKVAEIIPEAAPKNVKYVREEVVIEEAVEGKGAVLDEDGNVIEEAVEAKEAVTEWRDTDEIESDYHTLSDRPLIMALINAHKDQSEKIAQLEARIETLEAA